jgi:hypothetical protein
MLNVLDRSVTSVRVAERTNRCLGLMRSAQGQVWWRLSVPAERVWLGLSADLKARPPGEEQTGLQSGQ